MEEVKFTKEELKQLIETGSTGRALNKEETDQLLIQYAKNKLMEEYNNSQKEN